MFLQLLSLPSLQEDYSVEVSGQARLVHGTTTEVSSSALGFNPSLPVLALVFVLINIRIVTMSLCCCRLGTC